MKLNYILCILQHVNWFYENYIDLLQTLINCISRRTCVRLMKIPVDGDTLHAVLQVCVRFTRDYQIAEMAAEMGVVRIMLNLMSTTVFSGFLGLATILIRHILEEPGTLYSAIEKVSSINKRLLCYRRQKWIILSFVI